MSTSTIAGPSVQSVFVRIFDPGTELLALPAFTEFLTDLQDVYRAAAEESLLRHGVVYVEQMRRRMSEKELELVQSGLGNVDATVDDVLSYDARLSPWERVRFQHQLPGQFIDTVTRRRPSRRSPRSEGVIFHRELGAAPEPPPLVIRHVQAGSLLVVLAQSVLMAVTNGAAGSLLVKAVRLGPEVVSEWRSLKSKTELKVSRNEAETAWNRVDKVRAEIELLRAKSALERMATVAPELTASVLDEDGNEVLGELEELEEPDEGQTSP